MESSSFFYYTPDTTSQTKQHGHFLPHPNGHSQQQQQQQQQSVSQCDSSLTNSSVPYPSSLVYSRPTSSHLKPPTLQAPPTPLLATGTLSSETLQKQTGLLTPLSPNLLGMDGHNGGDMYLFSSTPILSCNSVSTPPMSTVTTTPLITSWSLDDACNSTITPSDIQLPGTPELWKESPPMTPAYIYPPSLLPTHSSPSVLLPACPSLSPASDHSSSPELDFCDPRKLTYPSPNPSASDKDLEFATLPSIRDDDDEHGFMLRVGNEDIKTEEKDLANSFFGLEEQLSDFESDNELVSGLMNMPQNTVNPADLLGGKPQRDGFDEEEGWEIDDMSDDESVSGDINNQESQEPLSPPPSDLSRGSSATPPSKQRKVQRKVKVETYEDSEAELDDIIANARANGYPEHACDGDFFSHSSCHEPSITPAPTEASFYESSDSQEISPAPVVRRGRKQSLTEDPSKTFVCHLCSRRFRRQEHLKRHFRSLHTKDKPFSCGECGKKFSRSDNLSQHARTHGSTTIHMTLIDGDMIGEDDSDMLSEHSESLGIVLVNATQASSGIKDKVSSSSSESKKNRRKRKRDE